MRGEDFDLGVLAVRSLRFLLGVLGSMPGSTSSVFSSV